MSANDIGWAFLKPTDVATASEAIARYQNGVGRFVLFENGTVLFLQTELDKADVIAGAMSELSMKRDFEVLPMKDGNFTVWLASPVCVFMSSNEASEILSAIRSREAQRLLSGEQQHPMPAHAIIGVAGREKAHRDAKSQVQVFRSHESPSLALVEP